LWSCGPSFGWVTFSKDINKLELVWHKDKEDRHIEILDGEGWSIQMDDQLPLAISKGDRIFIKNKNKIK
jgi:hypothetical protein